MWIRTGSGFLTGPSTGFSSRTGSGSGFSLDSAETSERFVQIIKHSINHFIRFSTPVHGGIAHALTCIFKRLFQPIYNGIHFMPKQSAVLRSCALVSFVWCSLQWCMSTCTVHCVRSTVVSLCSFRVHLSSTVRASLRLHCVPSTLLFPSGRAHLSPTVRTLSLKLHTVFIGDVLAEFSVRTVYSACLYYTLCSSTAVFLLELSVRTVYSACLYCNTLLCIGPCRLQCMSLRQHCVPSTAFVFARVLCSCHLPSTVLFTTHHVPFESLSFTRVPKYGIC